jgi:hypothetical protein
MAVQTPPRPEVIDLDALLSPESATMEIGDEIVVYFPNGAHRGIVRETFPNGEVTVIYNNGNMFRDKMLYRWRFAASSPKYKRLCSPTTHERLCCTSRKRASTDFYVPCGKSYRSTKLTTNVVEVECFSDDDGEDDEERTGSTYEISNDKLTMLASVSEIMKKTISTSSISEASSYATAGSTTNEALCDAMTTMRLPNSFVEEASLSDTPLEKEYDATDASLKRIRKVAESISAQLLVV